MQRILSNFSRKLSNTANSSHLQHFQPQKAFTSLVKPSFNSNYNRKDCIFSFSRANPCQPNHTLSKVHGFMSNPLLTKQFMSVLSNTHFRVSTKKLTDCKAKFFSNRFASGFSGLDSRSKFYRNIRRSWLPQLTPDGMVLGLIVANVAVFMLWRIADQSFMAQNFMISLDNFKSGRMHTLITSAFSHIDMEHIISNMIGLYFFGRNIGRSFGPEYLLKLYVAGAVGGSLFFLVHHAYMALSTKERIMGMDPSRTPGLGASGAVNAIMLLYIFLHPRATMYFQLIIPVPAILLGIILIGKDVLRIVKGNSNISGSAHLGGAAVAALAYARIKKGRF